MQAHRAVWGRTIKAVRDKLGLTQQQFAEALGVDQAAVSHWERGSWAPSLENQLKIARLAKRPHHKLFDVQAVEA